MQKVAIIGPIGSGKSEVLRICSDLDLPGISSDHIAKLLMELPGAAHDAIIEEFGNEFSQTGKFGVIDRSKLGEYVFSNPEKMKILENLLHPHVWQLATAFFLECEKKEEEICFIEVSPPSAGIASQFDEIIYISTNESIRSKRCIDRGMSQQDFDARNIYQGLHCQYLDISTETIENNQTIEDLQKSISQYIKRLLESNKSV